MLDLVVNYLYTFIKHEYGIEYFSKYSDKLDKLFPGKHNFTETKKLDYLELQKLLSIVNEKYGDRKGRGVYYTPNDITDFIVKNSFNLLDKQKDFDQLFKDRKHCESWLYKTVYDPTCGAGEFLLSTLVFKIGILQLYFDKITVTKIQSIVKTIYGNDLNNESVCIAKARIVLFLIFNFGLDIGTSVIDILNNNFTNLEYINGYDKTVHFDLILGNPPYVEDGKTDVCLCNKYGNIYANVLSNMGEQLNNNGVIGVIIPLSFIATPRMHKIRKELRQKFNLIYILNYSDRPDCLFQGVHQKLCICICSNVPILNEPKIYTSHYNYWYKNERKKLFENIQVIENNFYKEQYIPKIGNKTEVAIYKKIINNPNTLDDLILDQKSDYSLYLNMRAAFWIKIFGNRQKSNEYKLFNFKNELDKVYFYCLVSSSLFWWFWTVISDCWHITKKELLDFKIPYLSEDNFLKDLYLKLENKLETTKLFVGTKQVDYEYKHKLCLQEIKEIDDYISKLYGLSEKETLYIENYMLKYRTGSGCNGKGCN